jgi:hypothetical protein
MQKENVFFFSFSSESNFSKGESYQFYFTSAIRLHTSDIFQPYSFAKIRNNPHNPCGYADFYTNLDKMAGASVFCHPSVIFSFSFSISSS